MGQIAWSAGFAWEGWPVIYAALPSPSKQNRSRGQTPPILSLVACYPSNLEAISHRKLVLGWLSSKVARMAQKYHFHQSKIGKFPWLQQILLTFGNNNDISYC